MYVCMYVSKQDNASANGWWCNHMWLRASSTVRWRVVLFVCLLARVRISLRWWRHFAKNSDLLFHRLVLSDFIISNFSSIPKLQRLPPGRYAAARFKIDHLMLYSFSLFFKSHTYLESSVSDEYVGLLNDFYLWFLYLTLNSVEVIPMYSLVVSSWGVVISATLLVKHFPSSAWT